MSSSTGTGAVQRIRPRPPLVPPVLAWSVLAAALGFAAIAAVSYPFREILVRAIAGSSAGRLAGPWADPLLLLLVGITGVLAILTWLRNRRRFWILTAAGIGTLTAYALNEAIKSLVRQERPCSALVLDAVLACPSPGSWSWPSNHSVIAASFAVACLFVLRRIGWLMVPLALLTAFARVGGGVHYVHDVATGLCVGALVVLASVFAFRPLVVRLTRRPYEPDPA